MLDKSSIFTLHGESVFSRMMVERYCASEQQRREWAVRLRRDPMKEAMQIYGEAFVGGWLCVRPVAEPIASELFATDPVQREVRRLDGRRSNNERPQVPFEDIVKRVFVLGQMLARHPQPDSAVAVVFIDHLAATCPTGALALV